MSGSSSAAALSAAARPRCMHANSVLGAEMLCTGSSWRPSTGLYAYAVPGLRHGQRVPGLRPARGTAAALLDIGLLQLGPQACCVLDVPDLGDLPIRDADERHAAERHFHAGRLGHQGPCMPAG